MRKRPSNRFRFLGNLVEFDSVIMQLYTDGKDAFIAKWVEEEDDLSKWILFKVTQLQYNQWIRRDISNRELVLNSNELFIVKCRNDTPFSIRPVKSVPLTELPENTHFFNPSNFNTKTLCLLKTIWQTP